MSVAEAAPSGRVSKKDKKKAKRYERRGKKAYRAEKWDDAIAAFELAHTANGEPRHLFNIGRCYEKKGDLFEAIQYVQTYIEAVDDRDERQDAEETRAILRGKLRKSAGELELDSEPSGAVVLMIGESSRYGGKTPLRRWLSGGTWRIQLSYADLPTRELEVFVPVGGTAKRMVELADPAPPAPGPGPAEEPETEPEATESERQADEPEAPPPPEVARSPVPAEATEGQHGLAWIALGGGAALVAAGAVFGVLGQAASDEVQGFRDAPGSGRVDEVRDAADTADAYGLTANVLFAVGGAALATGLVVYLAGGDEAGVSLTPGGLSLRETF